MKNGEFVDKLLASLSEEANGCTDVKRLLAIVGLAMNLLQPDLQVDLVRIWSSLCVMRTSGYLITEHHFTIYRRQLQEKTLPFMMIMLLNPYPRVRRYAAEQLFAKLSVDGETMFPNPDHLEEANNLLLNTIWHEERDSSGHIAESRNRIADLLNIQLTSEERNVRLVKKQTSRSVPRDEFENYASLINSTTA